MAYFTPFLPIISGKNHFLCPKSLFFRGWVGGFLSLGQLSQIYPVYILGGFPNARYGVFTLLSLSSSANFQQGVQIGQSNKKFSRYYKV